MDSIPRALDVRRSADMGKGPDIRIFPHIFPHKCVGILMLSLTKKNSKRRVWSILLAILSGWEWPNQNLGFPWILVLPHRAKHLLKPFLQGFPNKKSLAIIS